MSFTFIIGALVAYLLGSIPSGLWIGQTFFQKDIREFGSGNLGSTNAFRVLGPKAGSVVLFCDVFKGSLATILAMTIFKQPSISPLWIASFAVIGHTFPLFASFKGGKAVATGSGVFIFLYPMLSLLLLAIFFSTLFLTGYVSLGSILISLTAIGYLSLFETGFDKWIMIVMCIFVIYMHKKNIQRLISGTENQSKLKIGKGKKNDENH